MMTANTATPIRNSRQPVPWRDSGLGGPATGSGSVTPGSYSSECSLSSIATSTLGTLADKPADDLWLTFERHEPGPTAFTLYGYVESETNACTR